MSRRNLHFNVTRDDVRAALARRLPGIESDPPEVQAEHCITWIRANCLILDPSSFRPIPFDLYDYQEVFIHIFMTEVANARRSGPAGIRTEKSRQMGDTWLMAAIELYDPQVPQELPGPQH